MLLNRDQRRKMERMVNNADDRVKRELAKEGITIQELKEEMTEWLKIQTKRQQLAKQDPTEQQNQDNTPNIPQ